MPRVIYIHVPKCGGSSVSAALRLRYLASHGVITLGQGDTQLSGMARITDDYAQRRSELHALVAQGKRLITGHVQYDPNLHRGAARGYRFVTVLRDPVERFVSHYHYLQRKHPDPDRPDTLAGFLETSEALHIGSQYLFYFAGHSQAQARDPSALIRSAIANLARFDLVADLSDPEGCARGLRRVAQAPLLPWRRNVAPVPTTVPDRLRPAIERLCAPDLAIHTAVLGHRAAA
ncbi:MAG: sulfotransferase family 2 domain-containing protein [Pseudomonadota bacterium]